MHDRQTAHFLTQLHRLRKLQHNAAVQDATAACAQEMLAKAAKEQAEAAVDEAAKIWADTLLATYFDPEQSVSWGHVLLQRSAASETAGIRHQSAAAAVTARTEERFHADAVRVQARDMAAQARRLLLRRVDDSAQDEFADRICHSWRRS